MSKKNSKPDAATPAKIIEEQPMVDIDRFLHEVSARMLTSDGVPYQQPQTVEVEEQDRVQMMSFILNDQIYAVKIEHSVEVIKEPEITPVPGLPGWVSGVTNLHGEVLSVVDLSHFFNLGQSIKSDDAVLIVMQSADQKIGLIVSGVGLIYSFLVDDIISPPFEIPEQLVKYLHGVVDHQQQFVHILDCDSLLLGQQMQQFS